MNFWPDETNCPERIDQDNEVLGARRRGRAITVTVLESSHRWKAHCLFVAEWVSLREVKALQGVCMLVSMQSEAIRGTSVRFGCISLIRPLASSSSALLFKNCSSRSQIIPLSFLLVFHPRICLFFHNGCLCVEHCPLTLKLRIYPRIVWTPSSKSGFAHGDFCFSVHFCLPSFSLFDAIENQSLPLGRRARRWKGVVHDLWLERGRGYRHSFITSFIAAFGAVITESENSRFLLIIHPSISLFRISCNKPRRRNNAKNHKEWNTLDTSLTSLILSTLKLFVGEKLRGRNSHDTWKNSQPCKWVPCGNVTDLHPATATLHSFGIASVLWKSGNVVICHAQGTCHRTTNVPFQKYQELVGRLKWAQEICIHQCPQHGHRAWGHWCSFDSSPSGCHTLAASHDIVVILTTDWLQRRLLWTTPSTGLMECHNPGFKLHSHSSPDLVWTEISSGRTKTTSNLVWLSTRCLPRCLSESLALPP